MQSSVEVNTTNNLKWPSIPLLIPQLTHLMKKKQYKRLTEIIFEQHASASQKYDGTNVGKDEYGVLYGRNQLIPDKTNSYQSTPIKCVRECDTSIFRNQLMLSSGIESESIQKFVVYGELMCNKSLYNYSQDKLAGTHQVFGGVIKPHGRDCTQIADKLALAQYAFQIRNINDDEDEEQNDNEEQKKQDKIIMLLMNSTLATAVGQSLQVVPLAGHYESLYELVNKNYEWMLNGMGEGLVIISPPFASTSITKWKNGSEASATNLKNLNMILETIDENQEIFGTKSTQAQEFFQKMLQVEMSKLINGSVVKTVSKVTVQPTGGIIIPLTVVEQEQYYTAIKSAQSKFDHSDFYFQKSIKGLNEYSLLISQECLTDIQIDNTNKQQLDRHLEIIKNIIKVDFIAYQKANSKK